LVTDFMHRKSSSGVAPGTFNIGIRLLIFYENLTNVLNKWDPGHKTQIRVLILYENFTNVLNKWDPGHETQIRVLILYTKTLQTY